jgi:Ner family transcriptional regulator
MTIEDPKKASNDAEPPAQDWHPADIKSALEKAGYTMNKLAKSFGLTSPSTLSRALKESAPIAEQRIADAIGVHPKEIWPSRYYPNGEKRPRGYHAIQYRPSETTVNGNQYDGSSRDANKKS